MKHLLQKPVANLRKPYGTTIQEMRRYASFIGTSNLKDLLTDPSGSRRFICIEVTGPIQTNVTINYHQLYAQAMHDIMKGERYWLDDTDEAIVKEYNREFERVDPLEELSFAISVARRRAKKANGSQPCRFSTTCNRKRGISWPSTG